MTLLLLLAGPVHAQSLQDPSTGAEPASLVAPTGFGDDDLTGTRLLEEEVEEEQPEVIRRILRLGPAQARIVELPRPAGAVIVAAPDTVSAVLDSPQRLLLIPRQLSATSLTVLDDLDRPMLEAQVIISGRNNRSLRVTRGCPTGSRCPESTVEFCAGDCITLPLLATAPANPSINGTEPNAAANSE
ncbi:MAG: pilus assembly protein N-terminal domain-containing protein [Alphaproteobacteria bacterium]|nr:pilus assembly protein N-terminal domain-containing protein [Alphaproteobacteria bacterium SS10]